MSDISATFIGRALAGLTWAEMNRKLYLSRGGSIVYLPQIELPAGRTEIPNFMAGGRCHRWVPSKGPTIFLSASGHP
jgi:hypothetical protein